MMKSEATKKQMDFIENICWALELNLPTHLTKATASKFISSHIEEYEFRMDDLREAEYDYAAENYGCQ